MWPKQHEVKINIPRRYMVSQLDSHSESAYSGATILESVLASLQLAILSYSMLCDSRTENHHTTVWH